MLRCNQQQGIDMMMKEGFKVFYTTVCINYAGNLIVIPNYCYVSNPNKLGELIKGWNRLSRGRQHLHISPENQALNEQSKLDENVSSLEYIH